MLSPRVSVELARACFPELVATLAKRFPSSLKILTFMPVRPTRSFTFTASVRRIVNFRITGTLIPPPFLQRPLGSSNGAP